MATASDKEFAKEHYRNLVAALERRDRLQQLAGEQLPCSHSHINIYSARWIYIYIYIPVYGIFKTSTLPRGAHYGP